MERKSKIYECPFKTTGDRRCPAKLRDLNWNCPLAMDDGLCALYVVASQLYVIQKNGVKLKK